MSEILPVGTVLDGRYLVGELLGRGGFGITYRAVNQRLNMPVAIKELFCADCCTRGADGRTVVLPDEKQAVDFAAQKQRFLREARTIRDFAGERGIVQIMDYFEENGTAYIVMELLQGVPLERAIETDGAWDGETAFRKFLPVAETLSRLHAMGIIHHDISPDNIILLNDGTMKLIDFGAARKLGTENVSRVIKESYSAPEQMDRNAKIGPGADVYALCATLYKCVTAAAPVSAMQRMFLDEMAPPSQIGAKLEPEYEEILLKGLRMDPEKRYRGASQLAEDMRAVLPHEQAPVQYSKTLLYCTLAALAALCSVLGVLYYQHTQSVAYRLDHMETERFVIFAAEDNTASEFAKMRNVLEKELAAFAGAGNYTLTVDGECLEARVPLALFGDAPVDETLRNTFIDPPEMQEAGGHKAYHFNYELQGEWESVRNNLMAGVNQVDYAQVPGNKAVLCYEYTNYIMQTKGEIAGTYIQMKTRLDALGVPYAFGLEKNHKDRILICLPVTRLNRFVIYSLGAEWLYLAGNNDDVSALVDNSWAKAQLLPIGNRYAVSITDNYGANYVDELTKRKQDTVYLQVRDPQNKMIPFADMPVQDIQILDAQTVYCFSHLRARETDQITEEEKWLGEYLCAWLNDSFINAEIAFYTINLNSDDRTLLMDGDLIRAEMPLHFIEKPSQTARDQLRAALEAEGIHTRIISSDLYIDIRIAPGECISDTFIREFERLREKYDLCGMDFPVVVCAYLDGETGPSVVAQINRGASNDCTRYGVPAALSGGYKLTDADKQKLSAWWDALPTE